MPPTLAAGCQPPGFFEGMGFWREWIINLFPKAGDTLCRAMGGASPGGLPDWLIFIVMGVIGAGIVASVAAMGVSYIVWLERRLIGRFQNRLGPNRVGPFGLLQPIADALKLFVKEDVTPRLADKLVFSLAPLVFAATTLLLFAVIPWAEHATLANLGVSIVFLIAVSISGEIGIFMGGWASNNRYALFGAMRAVGLLVSYELPLVLAIGAMILLTGTLSMSAMVDYQRYIPNILFQPLGFLIFIIAITAELNRAPFDLMEAESEIIAGFHTEYSGMKWAMVQLGEYGGMIAFSAVIATLFLSGWKGPVFLPGYLWLALKTVFIISIFVWVRATVPRMRIDHVMDLGWKFLLPLAVLNLFVTAVEVVVFPGQPSAAGVAAPLPAWLIPVNMAIALVAIVAGARLLKFRGETRQVIIPGRRIITPAGGLDPVQAKGA